MFEILYLYDFPDRTICKIKTFINQPKSICCSYCKNQISPIVENYALIEDIEESLFYYAFKIKTNQIIISNNNLIVRFCGCALREAACLVCLRKIGRFRVNVAEGGCQIGHEDYNYLLYSERIDLMKANN